MGGEIDIKSLVQRLTVPQKEVMTINDCAAYTGLSVSYLYKLTSKKTIPHFKPRGKNIYFKRTEIEQWLLRNKRGEI